MLLRRSTDIYLKELARGMRGLLNSLLDDPAQLNGIEALAPGQNVG